MDNLVNIIESIVNAIDLQIPVTTVDGIRWDTCNTLHLTVGKIVLDDQGRQYRITDFSINEWVEVEPVGHAITFSGAYMVAPTITNLHGTPSSTNKEYLQISELTLEKTPFVWLLEEYAYDGKGRESSVIAAYDVRLFFMDWADSPQWLNDQHNELCIKPMENLAEAFKNEIDTNFSIKTVENFRTTVRPRFGVQVSNKGSDKKIIQEDLSGVELSFTFELYDTDFCKC